MTRAALRRFREAHGLTQARLADAIKNPRTGESLSVSTVAHWEQGRDRIPWWLAASLAALPIPTTGPAAKRRKGGG